MKTIKALAALIFAPLLALYRLIAEDVADFKALAASSDRADIDDDDDEIVGVNPATGLPLTAAGVDVSGMPLGISRHED